MKDDIHIKIGKKESIVVKLDIKPEETDMYTERPLGERIYYDLYISPDELTSTVAKYDRHILGLHRIPDAFTCAITKEGNDRTIVNTCQTENDLIGAIKAALGELAGIEF